MNRGWPPGSISEASLPWGLLSNERLFAKWTVLTTVCLWYHKSRGAVCICMAVCTRVGCCRPSQWYCADALPGPSWDWRFWASGGLPSWPWYPALPSADQVLESDHSMFESPLSSLRQCHPVSACSCVWLPPAWAPHCHWIKYPVSENGLGSALALGLSATSWEIHTPSCTGHSRRPLHGQS